MRLLLPSFLPILPFAWTAILIWLTADLLKSKMLESRVARCRSRLLAWHPMMAYSVVFIIGGTILCLYWWGINRALLAAREITSKPAATSQVADAVPPVATPTDSSRISPASIVRPAIIQLRPAPRKPHEIPSPYTQKSSPNREDALKNAQEAAEHYRDTPSATQKSP